MKITGDTNIVSGLLPLIRIGILAIVDQHFLHPLAYFLNLDIKGFLVYYFMNCIVALVQPLRNTTQALDITHPFFMSTSKTNTQQL